MTDRRPVGVVLTGGASTRMGADKATLAVGDVPMAVRVADAMTAAGCRPVECQGGDLAALAEIGLGAVPDRSPGQGPVAAIRDALARHDGCDVVVAACDLVDLDAATLRLIVAAGNSGEADVAVAATDGDRHLVSWWRAGRTRLLDDALRAGATSYRSALASMRTVDVEVDPLTVRNVNTPSDLGDVG